VLNKAKAHAKKKAKKVPHAKKAVSEMKKLEEKARAADKATVAFAKRLETDMPRHGATTTKEHTSVMKATSAWDKLTLGADKTLAHQSRQPTKRHKACKTSSTNKKAMKKGIDLAFKLLGDKKPVAYNLVGANKQDAAKGRRRRPRKR